MSGADRDSTAVAPIRRASVTSRLWRLCLKELRETLRDRRTMVTLILMPLIVYPLLSIVFQRFLIETWQATEATKCIVAVESEEESEAVTAIVAMTMIQYESVIQSASLAAQQESDHTFGQTVESEEEPQWEWPSTDWLTYELSVAVVEDLNAAILSGQFDIGVRIGPFIKGASMPEWVEVVHRPNSYNSRLARQTFERYLQVARDTYLRTQLASGEGSLPPLPMRLRYRAMASEAPGAVSLATLIPLILVLMTVTGAVYPAIDLTAGERERGTMEALIAAPVPRMGLLFAKYIAVVVVALLTATANLIAMSVTLWSSGVGKAIFGAESIGLGTMAAVFGLTVLFAAFFSSVLLTVTSFARSFKEAQAYLIPLILLSLGPSLICLAPGLQLNGMLAVTPLVNIVLLARNVLEGQNITSLAALCVISTVLYAAAALAVAAKVFGSDAILYGSPTGWRDVFRRTDEPREVPTLASAFGALAVLFPIYVITVGAMSQFQATSLVTRLFYAAAVTVTLFGILPWCSMYWGSVKWTTGFRLNGAAWPAYIGAVVLGLGVWPMLQQLVLSQGVTDEQQFQLVEKFRNEARQLSPVVILLTMAVIPAVFEELFFRGFLFSALRQRTSGRNTVLLTAVLFGAFHVLAKHALATERFLPTTLMGLILGWVCWRTASVLPGMLLHACHNSVLLLIFYYRDELESAGFGAAHSDVVPTSWLLASAAAIVVGAVLMMLKAPSAREV